MTQPTTAEAPAWYQFVLDFDATKKAFDDNYGALVALGPEVAKYPGLYPGWETLVNEGADHYNKLQQLQATRDYIAGWLNWVQSGATGVFNWLGRQVGFSGLDIAPVYIIASLGAASLALYQVTQWLARAYDAAQRWNTLVEIRKSNPNATPGELVSLVNSVHGEPPSNNFLGIPWALLAWAAVAVYLGPPLLKAITGSKR